jgi:hypothetical protein
MRGRPTLASINPKLVRTILYLRSFTDMSLMEIARATGISMPTVYKYTRHIPSSRRYGSLLIFSPKKGIVGVHRMPMLVKRKAA